MKNNFLFFVMVVLTAAMTTTSCTKDNATTPSTEQTTLDFPKAIVGTWQIAEKGVEVAMHDGHVCTDPENRAADKITYMVQWEKATSDENQEFKSNGDYNTYQKSTLTCQGSYKISDSGLLEAQTDCDNYIAKIEALTTTILTVRQGSHFFKYQKLD